MPQANVIRWRDGLGWIVLSGGGDFTTSENGDIDGTALERSTAGKPVAYIWAAGDVETADRHLAALEELGGPTGFLVDVLTEDDDTIRANLAEAGVVILGDGPEIGKLRSGLLGAAAESMRQAYELGAVIIGIGAGAAVLGTLIGEQTGLNWLDGAVIQPEYENKADQLRAQLVKHPEAYGIGVASGSALALGPGGEIERWGKGEITVLLGAKVV